MRSTNLHRVLYITALAELATMLSWFNYSAILPSLRQEWQLSAGAAGLILAAFQVGYVLSTLVLGSLTDRFSPRHIFAAGAAVAALSGVGFALFATGPGSALVLRVLAGVGLGGVYVPGLRYLADLFPPERRSAAFGIYVGALVIGSGGSLLAAAPLTQLFHWRVVMALTSGCALIGAGLILAMPEAARTGKAAALRWASAVRALRSPGVLPMILAYTGHMWELYAFWGWVGPFLTRSAVESGLSLTDASGVANLWAGLIIAVGGPGCILAGRLADRYGRAPVLRTLLVVSGLCSMTYGWLIDAPMLVLGVIGLIYGLSVVADSPVYSAGVSQFAPPELVGMALAFQQVVGFGITILSQSTVGWVLQATGETPASWGWALLLLSLGPGAAIWMLGRAERLRATRVALNPAD